MKAQAVRRSPLYLELRAWWRRLNPADALDLAMCAVLLGCCWGYCLAVWVLT